MSYAIEFDPHAERQLKKFPKPIRDQIVEAVFELRADPRRAGVKKLRQSKDGWRVKIRQKYRALFTIDDKARRVVVFDVDLRDTVYKDLS